VLNNVALVGTVLMVGLGLGLGVGRISSIQRLEWAFFDFKASRKKKFKYVILKHVIKNDQTI